MGPLSMLGKVAIVLAVVIATMAGSSVEAATKSAEWTLMIFMNAKNNLEADALDNFAEIAGNGSTPEVNVLVEMGRPLDHVTTAAENWSGVLRFRVTKGQEPVPEQAVADLRDKPDLSDLGSLRALQDFVDWSVQTYPAKKYMLVIWNHGQGWRFQMAEDKGLRLAAASRAQNATPKANADLQKAAKITPQLGGFRAVSFDQDTGNFLYNSDIQAVTEATSSSLKKPIDIVGFDACLMSMLETAYALRRSSSLLVASEELEPGAGWNYDYFLSRLIAKPSTTPFDLSKTIVEAYKARYGDFHSTTLSVLDLEKTRDATNAFSYFADTLIAKAASERTNLEVARAKMTTYGAGVGLKTSIDLIQFIAAYAAITKDEGARKATAAARASLSKIVLSNYASARSAKSNGSNGIAIYFPATYSDFLSDPYHDGYLKENTSHVVEFVAKERWADFLKTYLH